jgi:hypothetical protein
MATCLTQERHVLYAANGMIETIKTIKATRIATTSIHAQILMINYFWQKYSLLAYACYIVDENKIVMPL